MKKSTYLISLLFLCCSIFSTLSAQSNKESFETLKKINEKVILLLSENKYSEIIILFAPELQMQLSSANLEQVWNMLNSKFGAYKSTGKTIEKVTAEKTTVLTVINFENESFDLSTSLNEGGLLNSFNILPLSNKTIWQNPMYGQERNTKKTNIKIGKVDPLLAELLSPKKDEKNTLMVFVHGSGPNDMDESLGPNKFFKDLAYGLANRGIASLRYNKRTYDYPGKMAKKQFEITIDDEVTNDAVLAIQKAKSLGYKKVFLAGHSLGGHMAPKIADQEEVDGVIILAGNSSAMVDLLVPQFEYLFKNDSTSGITEFQLNAIKTQVETVISGKYDKDTHPMMLPLSMSAIYWKSLEDYVPIKIASKQKQPYLILNGSRDYQVDVAQAKAWKKGNSNKFSRTRIFEGLNHMFIYGTGICLPAEYEKVGHVDLAVIEEIKNWIKELD